MSEGLHAERFEPLLECWFDGDVRDAAYVGARMAVLFGVDAAFDAMLRERFEPLVQRALAGELDGWAAEPRGALALVLALDQLPRNIYRGSAHAFAGDARARAAARGALCRGFAEPLALVERLFFYLPFEHAEDLALQDLCVTGYEALHALAPPEFRELTAEALQAGKEHREVIRRFGRFPHRNRVLGRPSTAEELAWLERNGGGWGQGVPAAGS